MKSMILRKAFYLLSGFLFIVFNLVVFKNFLKPGLPTGYDLGTHFYLSEQQYALLQETGYWDGLLPQWYAGFSPFSSYPHLLFSVFAIFKFCFEWLAADEGIYKFLLILVFYLPIVGVFFLAYSISKSRIFSFIAAAIAISVSVFSGGGIQGHFLTGLVNQTLGLGLYLFCITFFIRWQQTAEEKYTWLASSFLALIAQAHLITLCVTLCSLALLAFADYASYTKTHKLKYQRENLNRTLMAWVIAPGISIGCLAFKVLFYWEEHGTRTGWGDVSLLNGITSGMLFSSSFVNVAAPILILAGLSIRRFRTIATAILICAIFLFVLGKGYLQFDDMFDMFNSVFKYRAWGFAGMLMAALTGVSLAYIWDAVSKLKESAQPLGKSLVFILVTLLLSSSSIKMIKDGLMIETTSTSAAAQKTAYMNILKRIEAETPKESVIIFEMNGSNAEAPFLYLPASLAIYSKRVLLQGQQIEASKLNFDEAIGKLGDDSYEVACHFFHNVAATHYLAWSDATVQKFSGNPCFKEIMQEGHFHLFEYRDANYTRLIGDVGVKSFGHSRHEYSWVVESNTANTPVKLGFAYHPRFHVFINGKEVAPFRADDNFVGVSVPTGKSIVNLKYAIPSFEIFISFIDKLVTFAAFLHIVLYFLLPTRMRLDPRLPLTA